MKSGKVTIIGGGAAGLFAAMSAAESGASVTILEKMDRPARKLAITGKGRCNLTTNANIATALKEFGPNGKFLKGAFSRFYNTELLEILNAIGIETAVERGERVFPLSMRAPDAVAHILARLRALGVEIVTGAKAIHISVADGSATGVETAIGSFESDSVILATGGKSYPATGSTGDGYALASALGHSIINPIPALVPIQFKERTHVGLSQLTFKNARATLLSAKNEKIREEFGEVTFAAYGVTGPAILPLGKHVVLNADKGPLRLELNIKPALSAETLDKRLQRDFAALGNANAREILTGLLPSKAIETYSELWKLAHIRRACEVTKAERANLAKLLTSLQFEIEGVRPFAEAIVTAGGVSLNEVSPKTMESKIVRGLYICGELLDLDAGTGGFNLQCAFSTGYIAGLNASGSSIRPAGDKS